MNETKRTASNDTVCGDPLTQSRGWLDEAGRVGKIIEKLAETLVLLDRQQVTLEQKAIAQHFARIASQLGLLLEALSNYLRRNQDYPCAATLTALQETDCQLEQIVDEFLKIARYDSNVLEQYFEHDFLQRLLKNTNFVDVLGSLEATLKTTAGQQSGP